MKTGWICFGLAALFLGGCDRADEAAPKAEIVPESEVMPVEAVPPQAPASGLPEFGEAPKALPVAEEEEHTAGDRVDHAIEATGHGLRVAGEKTKEGVSVAAEKTGEALHTAGEKTEEGVKKAAESTGRFLQRVGEKIVEAAEGEVAEP